MHKFLGSTIARLSIRSKTHSSELGICKRRQLRCPEGSENSWSRTVLIHQLDSDLYSRQGGALTNFEAVLPAPQSDLAQSLLKSEYNLDFLNLHEKALERDLERALLEHMQKFLLELGVGFAFIGSQYRLEVEGDEFFADLLFSILRTDFERLDRKATRRLRC